MFKVMRSTGDHKVMRDRISKFFPTLTLDQSDVIASNLCTFFLNDYPWVSAVLLNDYAIFQSYCKSRLRIPVSSSLKKVDARIVLRF